MAEVEDKLDIDRVSNLVTGFGWRITKTETTTDRLILTLEKNRTPGPGEETAPPT